MISRSDFCSFSSRSQPHPSLLPSGHLKTLTDLPTGNNTLCFFHCTGVQAPSVNISLVCYWPPDLPPLPGQRLTACPPRDGTPLSCMRHICYYVGSPSFPRWEAAPGALRMSCTFCTWVLRTPQGLSPSLHPGVGQPLVRVKEVSKRVIYKCRRTTPEPPCPPPTSTVSLSHSGPPDPALVAQGQVPGNSGQPCATVLTLLKPVNPKPAHPASPAPSQGNHDKASCPQCPILSASV